MIRWLVAGAVTVAANLLLLLLMARLVEGGPPRLAPSAGPAIPVDLVQVRREPPPPPEPRHEPPPPPPPPESPPSPPPARTPDVAAPRMARMPLDMPSLKLPLRVGTGPFIGAFVPDAPPPLVPVAESEVAPLVRVPPRYPRKALLSRIEGRVVVELTIQPDGSVSDPAVVEADPPGLFEDSVLRAVVRWRFAPKVVNGRAVARRAVQTVTFALDGG